MNERAKRKPVGMYGETPRVQIGKYSISRQGDKSVWIEHDDGEGGEFQDDLFEQFLDEFYNRHF